MKLLLTRHAETNYNVLGLSNADPSVDVRLTELGIEQAKSLSEQLKCHDFEMIVTSELKRTKQTAEIINRHHKRLMVTDPRLNDISMGFEGRPVSHYQAALKNAPNMWMAKFNDGESLDEAKVRVAEYLRHLRRQPYGSVLIVTHLTIAQIIYALITDLPEEEYFGVEIVQGQYIEIEL